MDVLTEKQKRVLGLRAEGYLNKQISAMLTISEVTIHQHLRACCKKLNASNTAHAIAVASSAGIFKTGLSGVSNQTLAGAKPDENHADNLNLTSRDRQILQRVASGHTNVQIAKELDMSLKTLEICFKRMALRNGTKGRTSLAMLGLQSGQISL